MVYGFGLAFTNEWFCKLSATHLLKSGFKNLTEQQTFNKWTNKKDVVQEAFMDLMLVLVTTEKNNSGFLFLSIYLFLG